MVGKYCETWREEVGTAEEQRNDQADEMAAEPSETETDIPKQKTFSRTDMETA